MVTVCGIAGVGEFRIGRFLGPMRFAAIRRRENAIQTFQSCLVRV